MMKKTILIFFCFSFFLLNAQNYNFRQISVEQGLTHTDVTSFVQDSSGFLYMGTNSGMARFDGTEIVTFSVTEHGLNNVYFNRIVSLKLDGRNGIWVGTQGGIIRFNITKQKFQPISYSSKIEGILSTESVSVRIFENSKVWLNQGGKAYCLNVRNDSIVSAINLNKKFNVLNNEVVSNMVKGKGSTIWILTLDKIFRLIDVNSEDIRCEFVSDISSIFPNSNYFSSGFLCDKDDNLWVLSLNNIARLQFDNIDKSIFKVRLFDINSVNSKGDIRNKSFLNATNIFQDSSGDIWFSTFIGLISAGHSSLNDEYRFTLYEEDQFDAMALSSNKVTQVLETKDGTIFVGTFGGGCNYFERNPKAFNTLRPFSHVSGATFSNSFVRAVYEKGNQLWIGTLGSGLVVYNMSSGTYKIIDSNSPKGKRLSDNNVRSIIEDHEGNIWVATLGGINIIDNNYNIKYILPNGTENGLPVNAVQNLAIDRFGRIWAGFWLSDLTLITPKSNGTYNYTRFSEGDGDMNILSNFVNSTFSDIEKNELIVSSDKGISRLILDDYGDVQRVYSHRSVKRDTNTMYSNYIWPIQKYNDSTYWVGTLGGGFSEVVFRTDTMIVKQTFAVENGAPFNDVECMLIDNNGKLWLAGKGLSKFDPDNNTFWNFDVNDGLQGKSFKIGGSHKGKSGRLYFGGTNGLTYFFPNEIVRNNYMPNPGFTKLEVHNKRIFPGRTYYGKVLLDKDLPYTDKLFISQSENEFSISFSAFHFANPDKNKFRYKLVGYDSEWSVVDSKNNKIFYSNLPPNTYELLLKAYNNDGVISNNIAKLSIVVLPPWWKTKLAISLYFILLLIAIFFTYRVFLVFIKLKSNLELKEIEEKKNEELHQMKLRFFTNISHELRTPLSLIVSPVESLKDASITQFQKRKYINIISRNVNRILSLVNELLDFRKAEAGTMGLRVAKQDILSFIEEITIGFSEMAKARNISLEFGSTNSERFIWFDPNHLEKIVYNLLSNAIKNTLPGGSISVNVSTEMPKSSSFKHRIDVSSESKFENYIYLSFKDTGVGITEKSLPDIFNRFYQVEETSGEKHLGSGIGLALVKSLVLVHKGKISVLSERDKGTEFVLALPVGDGCYNDSEKQRESITKKEFLIDAPRDDERSFNDNGIESIEPALEKKVLIVEDNTEVREFIRDEFSGIFTIFEAENGLLGLEKARVVKPDLIVTDVLMPKMDGIELTKLIKLDENLKHIPVIMLTARTDFEHERDGVGSGADLYLRKPFSIRLLELYVKNLLSLKKDNVDISEVDTYKEIRSRVKNSKEKDFYNKTLDIILTHLDNVEFSVDDLVSEIAMGRTMFYQRIKKASGMSAKELIRSVRMKKASELLATSDITISEVKDMVGFGSMSHFTQCFKKYYECTPSEYIKKFDK